MLAAKAAAGAEFAISQMFFAPDAYFRLLEAMAAIGCDLPVVPGLMPVTNVRQVERMTELSGTPFPPELAARFAAVADDPAAVRAVGVEVATALAEQLLAGGAPGLHFYTLNRSTATREIYASLGLAARA